MLVSTVATTITPPGTFYLDGYLNETRQHPGEGVHDEPLAILLLLEEDGVRALFVGLDLCLVSLSRTRALREGLSALLDVPDELVVISAVHSHSCPNGMRDDSLIAHDTPGYAAYVTGVVTQAASLLPGRLSEARPELLRTVVRGWYSNRNSVEKPFDDEAFVLRFRTEVGETCGAMLNFNCHSTVVGPTNMLISSDLHGAVRDELTEWVGIMPYAFTGASGDLGNRQFRYGNDFAELRRVSCGIATEIMKGSFSPVELCAPRVREFSYEVDYDNTVYYPEYKRQIADARAVLANPDSTDDARKLAVTEVSKLSAKLEAKHVSFPIVMRVIDLGGIVLVTFPGELGSMLGMRIKQMFEPRVAIVIGYANDAQGYFVPEGDFGLGYESFVTKMPRGGIERVLGAFEEWLCGM